MTAGAPPADGPAPAACGLDIAASGFLTTYSHDPLGNLIAVAQSGEARTFSYDGLSRLLSSTNPESGTTDYVYDTDPACGTFQGELMKRTDANGTVTPPAPRRARRGDADHRITGVTYPTLGSGVAATPARSFVYDLASYQGWTAANPVGRLVFEGTGSPLANAYFSYDDMGRPVSEETCTPANCGASGFTNNATYDLAGDPLTWNTGPGATLTATYDLAGRPLSLTSSADGALISQLDYNPRGQELSATFGDGSGETRTYDTRGRVISITDVAATSWVAATPGTGSVDISGTERTRRYPQHCITDCSVEYDYGTITVTVNGVPTTVDYGEGDTNTSLAATLAADLNAGGLVNASASSNVIYLTAKQGGANTNYSLSGSSQSTNPDFGVASFSATPSGSTLTGGADGHYVGGGTLYSETSSGYAPDGDLLSSNDSVMGDLTNTYNDPNQLVDAHSGFYTAAYAYDRYGNRWTETGTLPGSVPALSFTGNDNRADGSSYDPAGHLLGLNGDSYAYDGRGAIAAVSGGASASYAYDAEGRRVEGDVGGMVKQYVYGIGGQGLTITDGSGNLMSGETYFGGRYLGTQTPSGFVYAYADGLGSEHVRSNGEHDTNWPFGEFANFQNGVSPVHFTGKPYDSETGLDYFGARYYAPTLGRFMTPDWSATPEAVPYANLANPQSLNLYSYVLNNPATALDPDGHSHLIYDGATHQLILISHSGRELGHWAAYNNVALEYRGRVTSGPIPNGVYPILDAHGAVNHIGGSDTGPYGPNGDIRLKSYTGILGNEVTGAAIHAGRINIGGPKALTLACVRTCDNGIAVVNKTAIHDPLTRLIVKGNGKNIAQWLKRARREAHGRPRKGECVENTPCGN